VAQRIVDGLALPMAVAGHPALELCNTIAGWAKPLPKDYLRSYQHLAVLAGAVGLLPELAVRRLRKRAVDQPRRAADVLREAKALRRALYPALTEHEVRLDTVKELNRHLQRAAAAREIRAVGALGPRWGWPDQVGLRLPLLVFSWAAYGLLDTPMATDIGRCPGIGCGWLFLDPRGTRRWCIMSVCGNRAKARRFAARHRDGSGGAGG
jgi:predicted RNA-binding Zn ribbon-like protein